MTTRIATNDAEFVSALAASGTGDIVQLANAGTFGELTIPSTTASGVSVVGETPRVPTCSRVWINGPKNFTLDGIKVQISETPGTTSGDPRVQPAIKIRYDFDGLVIKNCLLRCGYAPDGFADFDPSADHTKYPDFGAPGGDLTFNAIKDTYPFGIGGDGTSKGSFSLIGNTIADFANAVKLPHQGGSQIIIRKNDFIRPYMDYLSIGFSGGAFTPIQLLELSGNLFQDCFSQPQDNQNPHGDMVQIYSRDVGDSSDSTTPIENLRILGNIGFQSEGSRGQPQRLFLSDTPIGYPFVGAKIIDNLLISQISSKGIDVASHPKSGSAGTFAFRNTVLTNPKRNVLTGNATTDNLISGIPASVVSGAKLNLESDGTYQSREFAKNNLVEYIQPKGFIDSLSANIQTEIGSPSNLYDTWFDVPEWNDVDTPDQLVAAFTPRPAYADYGAVRATDTDAATFRDKWSGDVKPWDTTPAYAGFRDQSDVAKSTIIESNWAIVHAQDTTLPLAVEGGEYRIADDYLGTGASSWTSSPGTVDDGKFLQLRVTSSNRNVTHTPVTVTIGTDDIIWDVTTLSDVQFPQLVFDGTQSFIAAENVSHGADSKQLTLACKVDADASGSIEFVIASNAGTSKIVRLSSYKSTGKFRIEVNNVSGTIIAQFDTPNAIATGVGQTTILFAVDMSADDGASGAVCYVNNAAVALTQLTWTKDELIGFSYASTNGRLTVGRNYTGTIDYVWLAAGIALDISDPDIRSAFSAGLIGATGKGVTGSSPTVFLVGPASDWNAGTANKGSGPAFAKDGADAVAGNAATWPPVLGLVLEAVTPEPHTAGNPITIRCRALGYAEAGETVDLATDSTGTFSVDPVALPEGVDGVEFTYTPTTAGSHSISGVHSGSYTAPDPLVLAVSDDTPTKTWQLMTGETAATLSITNVQPGDYGRHFRCVVSNAGGTATSDSAEIAAP